MLAEKEGKRIDQQSYTRPRVRQEGGAGEKVLHPHMAQVMSIT